MSFPRNWESYKFNRKVHKAFTQSTQSFFDLNVIPTKEVIPIVSPQKRCNAIILLISNVLILKTI